jgi:hypothetical protein
MCGVICTSLKDTERLGECKAKEAMNVDSPLIHPSEQRPLAEDACADEARAGV